MWKLNLIRFFLDRRLAVFLVVGAISLLAAAFSADLEFDSSVEIWFLEDDPNIVTYRDFLDRFGGDEIVVLGVFADRVFSPSTLNSLDRLTRAAEAAPYVRKVHSLTNIRIVTSSEEVVEIAPLMETLPTSEAEAAAVAARAAASKPLDQLLSRDGKATAVLIELEGDLDFAAKTELVRALEKIIETHGDGLSIALAGSPPLDDAFYRYSNRDAMVMGPTAALLVLIVSFVVFRRLSAALIIFSVVILANLWLFGLMGALGIEINVVTSALAAIVMAVGVADTIHVLADYQQQLMEGREKREAIEEAFSDLLIPCLFTTATTAAGMLSLLFSSLGPIKQFGWLSAVGVSFAFLISMSFIPALLLSFKPPNVEFLERQKRGPMTLLLARIGRPTRRMSWAIVAFSILLLAVSIWGATKIRVGANVMNYFRETDPMRVAMERVERVIGGSGSMELLVEAPNEGFKNPETLRKLERLSRDMESQPGVSGTMSVLDSLQEIIRAFLEEGERPPMDLPDSEAMAAQSYLLLEGEEDFDSWIRDDYSVGHISARVRISEADALIHKVPELTKLLAEEYDNEELKVSITGFIKLMGDMEVYLLDSQLRSFSAAFVVVTLMILSLLRSWRLAMLSMIPNLGPIVAGLGVMGLLDIPLDAGTVMVAGIALGLVVDDSIHLLVRLQRRLDENLSQPEAIRLAVLDTGRPIIITSIVLAGGFTVLLAASFLPNLYFGAISAVVVLFALAADLWLLPALLTLLSPSEKAAHRP